MSRHKDTSTHGDGQHLSETPDVSHIKNVDVTHEASDVSVGGVAKFILGLTIMTAVTFGLMWVLFIVLNRQVARKDAQSEPGPMARTESERVPPEPRLQAARGFGVKLENGQVINLDTEHAPGRPQEEYQVLRRQWEETLQKGRTDSSGKAIAIPIQEAMKKLSEPNALPTRPQAGSEQPGISLPTAASSGRVSVKVQ